MQIASKRIQNNNHRDYLDLYAFEIEDTLPVYREWLTEKSAHELITLIIEQWGGKKRA